MIGIIIKDDKAFENFCTSLEHEGVPFHLGGNFTVFIQDKHFDRLSKTTSPSYNLLRELQQDNRVEQYQVPLPAGWAYVPSREEVKTTIQEILRRKRSYR